MAGIWDPTAFGTYRYGHDESTLCAAPGSGKITGMSVANPTVVTSNAHGLSNGDIVTITGTSTTPTTVGTYAVSNVAANTFTVPVNVSAVATGTGYFVANRSANNARIARWGATPASAASNDLDTSYGGLGAFPVQSDVCGKHASVGSLTTDTCGALKAAGTAFDPSSATGLAWASVMAGTNGAGSISSTTKEVFVCFGVAGINPGSVFICCDPQTRQLYMGAQQPNTAPATFTATGLCLPAGPTPMGLIATSGGYRLVVKGVGVSSSTTPLTTGWGAASPYQSIGHDNGSANNTRKSSGFGVWCNHAWDGSSLSSGGIAANANLDSILTNLGVAYGCNTTPTGLILVLGTSLMAGAWQHPGEGQASLIAEARPQDRVVCLAAGGATSTQVATQVANAITNIALYNQGFTPQYKVAVLDACYANDAIAGSGTYVSATYQTNMRTIVAALQAAGFKVIIEAAIPLANGDTSDANVAAYETGRIAVNTFLRTLSGVTVTATDRYPPFVVTLDDDATTAQKAQVVRSVVNARAYDHIDRTTGNDPTIVTYNDQVHTGTTGTRSRMALVNATIATSLIATKPTDCIALGLL